MFNVEAYLTHGFSDEVVGNDIYQIILCETNEGAEISVISYDEASGENETVDFVKVEFGYPFDENLYKKRVVGEIEELCRSYGIEY